MDRVAVCVYRTSVLIVACCVALCAAGAAGRPACAEVVLNEVLADPALDWDGDGETSSTGDEWVEIYNRGAVPEALDGLRIGDLDHSWAYGFSGMLEPGAYLVVYGSDSKAWQQANGESAFGLRLANTGDTVVLWRLAGSDTLEVDAYTYLNHEAEDDRASGRRPDGADHWELYDGLNPYSGGALPPGNGCAPTPGVSNNCVTPVEETSWGEVKSRLR